MRWFHENFAKNGALSQSNATQCGNSKYILIGKYSVKLISKEKSPDFHAVYVNEILD